MEKKAYYDRMFDNEIDNEIDERHLVPREIEDTEWDAIWHCAIQRTREQELFDEYHEQTPWETIREFAKSYGSKSHTMEELTEGFRTQHIYVLDAGTSGNDDLLLGLTGDDVEADVLAHFELKELPESWSIRNILTVVW
ncbi:MAG: hypothetical protein ACYTBJ_01085 [Planctomycetota bacterium]|jgi:hypothetical protein